MDGNRRWAKAHALELYKGHDKGADTFGHLCNWCLEEGVKFLTVYAFSTENWTRADKEISRLFALMERYFLQEKANCIREGVRLKIIGERSKFSARVLTIIEDIETATAPGQNLTVQIALSYGGRDEIIRAIKKAAAAGQAQNLTEEAFAVHLDTAGTPDVDLVIRTGGKENQRLSNFLLWQTAYAELFFSNLLWPDFNKDEFLQAIKYFNSIKRKIGQ